MTNDIYGITMGDSSGIGPEVALNAWRKGEIRHKSIVVGDLDVLRYCNQRLGYEVPLRAVESLADYREGFLNVRDFGLMSAGEVTPGRINRTSGAAAREYVVAAAKAALAGEIAAMVTLPMNKEATQLSDPAFVGHTELIGAVCGASDVTIMLASEQLIVTHVSTHVSLREAIERAKQPRIKKIIQLTAEAVCRLKDNPRIAVAGLNPHAGEHGPTEERSGPEEQQRAGEPLGPVREDRPEHDTGGSRACRAEARRLHHRRPFALRIDQLRPVRRSHLACLRAPRPDRLRRDGDDIDPVGAVNDVEVVLAPGARRTLHVRADGEDAEITNRLRTQQRPRFDVAHISEMVAADVSRLTLNFARLEYGADSRPLLLSKARAPSPPSLRS